MYSHIIHNVILNRPFNIDIDSKIIGSLSSNKSISKLRSDALSITKRPRFISKDIDHNSNLFNRIDVSSPDIDIKGI